MQRVLFTLVALIILAAPSAAENLLLPVFAHNVEGAKGTRWSSELYLTNPNNQPVQVTLLQLLPGRLSPQAPRRIFMPPTRVVPPRSAVVWTAAGLAVDLGGADEAVGGLLLNADGPVHISSRTVRHPFEDSVSASGFPVGQGQGRSAIPMDELPPAGVYLLPAMLWDHRSDGAAEFDTYVGFTNPGSNPVMVTLDIVGIEAILLDEQEVHLPYSFEIPAESWLQVGLEPLSQGAGSVPIGPESFDLEIATFAPLAFYASVVDRSSQDPRTVLPVALR